MGSPLEYREFVQWHSGKVAQTSALRLLGFGTAVFPNEKPLKMLISHEIQTELLSVGFHARRSMEIAREADIRLTALATWPKCSQPCIESLSETLDALVHCTTLCIEWRTMNSEESPYKNRDVCFASHATFETDGRSGSIYIGPLAAAIVCTVPKVMARSQNRLGEV